MTGGAITQKEALTIQEILQSHAAEIERLAVEKQEAQDGQLREIANRHQEVYQNHYSALLSCVQGNLGDQGFGGNPFARGYQGGFGDGTNHWGGPSNRFEEMRPSPNASRMQDRIRAQGCLETNKWFAVRMLTTALESATPQVRRMCMDFCQDHANMAGELFHFMQSRGWYQVPQASQQLMSQVQGGFQPIGNQSQPVGAGAAGHTTWGAY